MRNCEGPALLAVITPYIDQNMVLKGPGTSNSTFTASQGLEQRRVRHSEFSLPTAFEVGNITDIACGCETHDLFGSKEVLNAFSCVPVQSIHLPCPDVEEMDHSRVAPYERVCH
jgi:hypothetical protein